MTRSLFTNYERPFRNGETECIFCSFDSCSTPRLSDEIFKVGGKNGGNSKVRMGESNGCISGLAAVRVAISPINNSGEAERETNLWYPWGSAQASASRNEYSNAFSPACKFPLENYRACNFLFHFSCVVLQRRVRK